MNFQQKLARHGKDCIPLTMIGLFQSLMAYNFLGLNLTPSHDKICPRKFISFRANSHFTLLAKSLFSWSLFKTYSKCSTCSHVVLKDTKIPSIQMIMNSSNFSWKIQFMGVVNSNGTLHNPNGIIRNLYKANLVFIVIFFTSSSMTRIC